MPTEAIFEVAHRNEYITIYWHLNDQYMGQTRQFHKLALRPARGSHMLTLVDEEGHTLEVQFSVIGQ